jgi:hypothetical protein
MEEMREVAKALGDDLSSYDTALGIRAGKNDVLEAAVEYLQHGPQ